MPPASRTATAPPDVPERARIEMTVSCRDCADVPKVPGAGQVHEGVQLMHNGVRVVAGGYYGDWMAEIIERLGGHHEPQEELVFHHLVERIADDPPVEPAIVELGAFWSYYASWFLRRFPAGRAVLLEPDPGYLEIGRRNLGLNGCAERAQWLAAAIGAKPRPPGPFTCESDGLERQVAVESVPSVLAAAGLERADILLVDVQGAELAALEGARSLLAQRRFRFVVVSTHHHRISGDPLIHQRCVQLLREAGGHVVSEHTVAESYSGDGLVVASFDDGRDAGLVIEVSRARAADSQFGDPLVELAGLHDLVRRLQAEQVGHRAAVLAEVAAIRAELHTTEAALVSARADVAMAGHACDSARREVDALRASRAVRVATTIRQILSRLHPPHSVRRRTGAS